MSDQMTVTTEPAVAFTSFEAMRERHTELLNSLKSEPDASITNSVLVFLQAGAATGAVLDEPIERNAAQGMLDYWKATLYTQRRFDKTSIQGPIPLAILA